MVLVFCNRSRKESIYREILAKLKRIKKLNFKKELLPEIRLIFLCFRRRLFN